MSQSSDGKDLGLLPIKSKLPEYLLDNGLDVSNSRKILCINPDHDDRSPSMSIFYPREEEPVVHCFSCLAPDTKVLTSESIKAAKDIAIGDLLYTDKGNWKPCTDIIKTRDKGGHLYEISTKVFDVSSVFTEDHDIIYVDELLFYSGSPFLDVREAKAMDLDPDKHLLLYPVVTNDKAGNLFKIEMPSELNGISVLFTAKSSYALGYLISNLCNNYEPSPDGDSAQILIPCNPSQINRISKLIQEAFSDIGYAYAFNMHYDSAVCRLVFDLSNRGCIQVLSAIVFGHDDAPGPNLAQKHSRILKLVSNESSELIGGFFRGSFNGRGDYKYCSRSLDDTIFLFDLLLSVGMVPVLTTNDGPGLEGDPTGPHYLLSISTRHSEFINTSGFCKIDGRVYLACEFTKSEPLENTHSTVYDFTVEDDHTFCVPGFAVHNCHVSYDIFSAAHILENKPRLGPSFMHENVKYLADKYDIPFEMKAMTDEQVYELNTFQAYQLACDYISRAPFTDKCLKELDDRKWDDKEVRKYSVGQCDSFENFRRMLKVSGFSARFLDDIDLGNRYIFNPDNLIFTVKDQFGRPVGFAARNLNYDGIKDDNNKLINGSKFINTRTTGVKCNIYRKSERLYLLDKARKDASPLIIMEGYGDALTAQLAGMKNAVAIGSLQLSEHHLNSCRRNGIYDVVICLDADVSGQEKAKEILDETLANIHDLRIRFIFLEEETAEDGSIISMDPDLFIRTYGADKFLSLPKVYPFSWRLLEFLKDDQADSQVICFSMIPIIISEPSPIKREGMIKELSEHTGYTTKVIHDEIDKITSSEQAKVLRRKDAVIDSVKKLLNDRSDSAELILQRGIDELSSIDRETNANSLNVDAVLANMLAIKQYQETECLHSALDFGPNFQTLSVALAGDIRGKMIVLGGVGNVGVVSVLMIA